MRPAAVASIILAIGVLGTGGYFANEWRVCGSLEQDFLDTTYAFQKRQELRYNVASLGIDSDDAGHQRADDLGIQQIQRQLEQVFSRCGMRAGSEARRKGDEVLATGKMPR